MLDIKDYDEDYCKLKTSYNSIIDNTISLFRDLNISNINEKFFFYCILLRQSQFSTTDTFTAEEPSYTTSSSIAEGMQIMTGYGVCRHMTGLFQNIMAKDGNNLSSLYVYGDAKPRDTVTTADHVVAIAKDNIRILMYDAMKAAVFELLSDLNIYSYFKGIDISFPDIPFTTLCPMIKKQLYEKVQYIKRPIYTREQMEYYLKQAKAIYRDNLETIKAFHSINSPDITTVSNLILKYKKKKYR